VWDFELNVNSPFPDPVPACSNASSKCRHKERESPLWDMELNNGAALPAEGLRSCCGGSVGLNPHVPPVMTTQGRGNMSPNPHFPLEIMTWRWGGHLH